MEGSVCRVTAPGNLWLCASSAIGPAKDKCFCGTRAALAEKDPNNLLEQLVWFNLCVSHRTTEQEHCSCGGFMMFPFGCPSV